MLNNEIMYLVILHIELNPKNIIYGRIVEHLGYFSELIFFNFKIIQAEKVSSLIYVQNGRNMLRAISEIVSNPFLNPTQIHDFLNGFRQLKSQFIKLDSPTQSNPRLYYVDTCGLMNNKRKILKYLLFISKLLCFYRNRKPRCIKENSISKY